MNNTNLDLLKSVKSKSRQEEINNYGKLISFRKSVIRNKKKYSRNIKHKSHKFDSYFILIDLYKNIQKFRYVPNSI